MDRVADMKERREVGNMDTQINVHEGIDGIGARMEDYLQRQKACFASNVDRDRVLIFGTKVLPETSLYLTTLKEWHETYVTCQRAEKKNVIYSIGSSLARKKVGFFIRSSRVRNFLEPCLDENKIWSRITRDIQKQIRVVESEGCRFYQTGSSKESTSNGNAVEPPVTNFDKRTDYSTGSSAGSTAQETTVASAGEELGEGFSLQEATTGHSVNHVMYEMLKPRKNVKTLSTDHSSGRVEEDNHYQYDKQYREQNDPRKSVDRGNVEEALLAVEGEFYIEKREGSNTNQFLHCVSMTSDDQKPKGDDGPAPYDAARDVLQFESKNQTNTDVFSTNAYKQLLPRPASTTGLIDTEHKHLSTTLPHGTRVTEPRSSPHKGYSPPKRRAGSLDKCSSDMPDLSITELLMSDSIGTMQPIKRQRHSLCILNAKAKSTHSNNHQMTMKHCKNRLDTKFLTNPCAVQPSTAQRSGASRVKTNKVMSVDDDQFKKILSEMMRRLQGVEARMLQIEKQNRRFRERIADLEYEEDIRKSDFRQASFLAAAPAGLQGEINYYDNNVNRDESDWIDEEH